MKVSELDALQLTNGGGDGGDTSHISTEMSEWTLSAPTPGTLVPGGRKPSCDATLPLGGSRLPHPAAWKSVC